MRYSDSGVAVAVLLRRDQRRARQCTSFFKGQFFYGKLFYTPRRRQSRRFFFCQILVFLVTLIFSKTQLRRGIFSLLPTCHCYHQKSSVSTFGTPSPPFLPIFPLATRHSRLICFLWLQVEFDYVHGNSQAELTVLSDSEHSP